MKTLTVICLLLIATICAPSQASGGDASGSIKGIVKDSTGAVLDEAVIVIQHWSVDDLRRPVSDTPIYLRPDSQGRFSVVVTPGVYDLFVSCPFCSPQTNQVQVRSEGSMKVEFSLSNSRYSKSTD